MQVTFKLTSVNLFSLNMVNLYILRKLVVNRTIFMKENAFKINGTGLIVNRILDWMCQLQAAVLISLTLKRLGVINLTYPVVFPKVYFLDRGKALVFFVTFNIIIRKNFLENFIEIPEFVLKI